MKHFVLAACLATMALGAVTCAATAGEGEAPPPPPKAPAATLVSVMGDVEGLRKNVTLDLEGATLKNVVEWLREAGVGIVLPASLLPADDAAADFTMVVKVQNVPLALVVDLFLEAGGYQHNVKVVEVEGAKVAVVAISASPGSMAGQTADRRRMMEAFQRNRPGAGGPPQDGNRPGGNRPGRGGRGGQGGQQQNNPNQPAAPVENF